MEHRVTHGEEGCGRPKAGGLVPALGLPGSLLPLRHPTLHLLTCVFNECTGKSRDDWSLLEAVLLIFVLTSDPNGQASIWL